MKYLSIIFSLDNMITGMTITQIPALIPEIIQLIFPKSIVIWLSRDINRAKKRRKFNVSWLLCIIQTQ